MNKLNSTELAIYTLVKRFVQRQAIVLEALKELRPDFFIETTDENVAIILAYRRSSQIGYWGEGKQWEYFIHGRGCRLIHTITGEPVEWDVYDLNTFNQDWFIRHLEWLLKQKNQDKSLISVKVWLENKLKPSASESNYYDQLRKLILPLLEQLRDSGLLQRDVSQFRYTLSYPPNANQIANPSEANV